jgi:hypothetical protein
MATSLYFVAADVPPVAGKDEVGKRERTIKKH